MSINVKTRSNNPNLKQIEYYDRARYSVQVYNMGVFL